MYVSTNRPFPVALLKVIEFTPEKRPCGVKVLVWGKPVVMRRLPPLPGLSFPYLQEDVIGFDKIPCDT